MRLFDDLAARASPFESQTLGCCLGGLKGTLEKVLRMLKPHNGSEAMYLPKLKDILIITPPMLMCPNFELTEPIPLKPYPTLPHNNLNITQVRIRSLFTTSQQNSYHHQFPMLELLLIKSWPTLTQILPTSTQ